MRAGSDSSSGPSTEYVTAMIGGQLFGLPIHVNVLCVRTIGNAVEETWSALMAFAALLFSA